MLSLYMSNRAAPLPKLLCLYISGVMTKKRNFANVNPEKPQTIASYESIMEELENMEVIGCGVQGVVLKIPIPKKINVNSTEDGGILRMIYDTYLAYVNDTRHTQTNNFIAIKVIELNNSTMQNSATAEAEAAVSKVLHEDKETSTYVPAFYGDITGTNYKILLYEFLDEYQDIFCSNLYADETQKHLLCGPINTACDAIINVLSKNNYVNVDFQFMVKQANNDISVKLIDFGMCHLGTSKTGNTPTCAKRSRPTTTPYPKLSNTKINTTIRQKNLDHKTNYIKNLRICVEKKS